MVLPFTPSQGDDFLHVPIDRLFLNYKYPFWRRSWTSANAWPQETPIHLLMASEDRIFDELGPISLPRDFSGMPRKDQLPALMGPRLRLWGLLRRLFFQQGTLWQPLPWRRKSWADRRLGWESLTSILGMPLLHQQPQLCLVQPHPMQEFLWGFKRQLSCLIHWTFRFDGRLAGFPSENQEGPTVSQNWAPFCSVFVFKDFLRIRNSLFFV